MPAFRAGDYPTLTIEVEDGPDITMAFGFVDYEEAAIHFQIEGLDLPVVIERDALIMAIIQGWGGQFTDVHADPTPEEELGGT